MTVSHSMTKLWLFIIVITFFGLLIMFGYPRLGFYHVVKLYSFLHNSLLANYHWKIYSRYTHTFYHMVIYTFGTLPIRRYKTVNFWGKNFSSDDDKLDDVVVGHRVAEILERSLWMEAVADCFRVMLIGEAYVPLWTSTYWWWW